MPACPACGKVNDDRSPRCGQCGASLATPPFVTATPATRRMGHTMLGMAPFLPNGGAQDARPSGPEANADGVLPPHELQPFAPVPATLTGLNSSEGDAAPVSGPTDALPPTTARGPSTLAGLAAQSSASPDPSQTLRGFDVKASAPGQGVARTGLPSAASGPLVESQREPAPTKAAPGNATLVGVSPFVDRQGRPTAVHSPSDALAPNATLMGVSPLVDGQGQPGAALKPSPALLKGTLLGVSPLAEPDGRSHAALPAASSSATSDNLNATVPVLDPTALATKVSNPHKTILGVAAPLAASTAAAGTPADADPRYALETSQDLQPTPAHKGTLLGVAMPGIAPLQPGQMKQSPSPPESPLFVPQIPVTGQPRTPRQVSSNPPDRASTDRSLEIRTVQRRRLAWVFGTAAALLVIVITVALIAWWTNVHLAVQVSSGESGTEQLVLTCSNCPDGTLANVESRSAKFKDKRAAIELTRRLSVGTNQLTLKITRPNRTRSEVVTVTVPIDFRVTSSVAELAADPPSISVQIESTPGTKFIVDGRTHTVGTAGKLTVPIDVSTSLTGPASVVIPFEQRLAYEVIRDGSTTKGTLVVQTGITALDVVTPGPVHITQNPTFTLSGRTGAQAKLTANGHTIPVSQDGTFRQEMALSAPGSTKLVVRAHEASQAPRLIEITLERVTNLRQRADELAQSLVADFDAVSVLASEKPDSVVALRGEVVAIETVNGSTRIVATSSCKHEPCLFSIRHGGPLSLRAGSRFLSIGKARLTPRPTNAAERDVTLDASLVVEDSGR